MTTEDQQKQSQTMPCLQKKKKMSEMIETPETDDVPTLPDQNSALAAFRAKEEEIERRRSEIRERLQAQFTRVEEEAKRLHLIQSELDSVTDPMRKEVAAICKKVEIVNRDVKILGINCQKKEKEYRESAEAFDEKKKEKAQLLAKLAELVSESEKLRSSKLEELCKNI
ncbi:hypothetical protein SASPL_122161 [Salvia splendens]|uniref:RAB6-interacting golgin n=1 Tax=Salvia splendens TaxID=180675 RepID=A0A8X8XL31_SALSN|nr:actin cytoskeleton-regulatory complex protein PAN1-like [Salvia splendens]KAG6414787.1 hypothetical protein SASPL_122161 [Salvia splendens]